MWKKVKIEGVDYLIKHSVANYLHTFQITDFIHLWCEVIKEDSLLQRCKSMNKLLEASDEMFLGHILALVVGEGNGVTWSFTDSNNHKVLNLLTSLEGFKFKINFLMQPASNVQFYEEVTCPLLTMISELEKRQNQLVNIIKGKDVEILEYKLEGGQISRKTVETEPFEFEAFSVKCAEQVSVSKSLVTSQPSQALTPLVQDLLDKISIASVLPVNVPENKPEVKQMKTKVKLKSPARNKKKKIYEDDEDEDDNDDNSNQNGKESNIERVKVKQEIQPLNRLTTGQTKPKFKKVLKL